MYLFPIVLLITRFLSLILAAPAPSPGTELARDVYLPLDFSKNGSLPNVIRET